MKKLIITTVLATLVAPTFAWGDREQGALLGLAIGAIMTQQSRQPEPVYIQPQQNQVIRVLPPVNQQPYVGGRTCLQHPYHDQYGRLIGYTISCH